MSLQSYLTMYDQERIDQEQARPDLFDFFLK